MILQEAQTLLSSLSQFTSVGFLFKSWCWELSTWTWQLWVRVLESDIAPQYHFCKVVMWPWSDQSQQRMSSRHIIKYNTVQHNTIQYNNIIQIWHLGECNINFYCTLKNDIARGAWRRVQYHFSECNENWYCTKPKCHICFIICLLLIQIKQFTNLKNYENVNIIDMFFHFQVLPQTIGLL